MLIVYKVYVAAQFLAQKCKTRDASEEV